MDLSEFKVDGSEYCLYLSYNKATFGGSLSGYDFTLVDGYWFLDTKDRDSVDMTVASEFLSILSEFDGYGFDKFGVDENYHYPARLLRAWRNEQL